MTYDICHRTFSTNCCNSQNLFNKARILLYTSIKFSRQASFHITSRMTITTNSATDLPWAEFMFSLSLWQAHAPQSRDAHASGRNVNKNNVIREIVKFFVVNCVKRKKKKKI